MLSVVLPAYNEEKMIQKAAGTIGGILQKEAIDYEIIFVDDGSKDGTWQQIEQTQKEDQHVNGVRFSRNFGKESAMMAGLENAGGDCLWWIVIYSIHQRQSWRCIGCGSRDTKLSRA